MRSAGHDAGMQDYQREFADFLWEAGSLKIGSFTLKSGRVSPLFLNTGLLDTGLRYQRLGEAFSASILERVGADGFDVVFGPAYKGIPLGVATAVGLAHRGADKACLSDRKEAKTHGAEAAGATVAKRLLGRPPADNARFVMVDDVLTDGATKVEAAALLREIAPKSSIVGLFIVLDRQEQNKDGDDAVAKFTERTGVPVYSVLGACDLIDDLAARGRITPDDLARCRAYWGEYGTPVAQAWATQATG